MADINVNMSLRVNNKSSNDVRKPTFLGSVQSIHSESREGSTLKESVLGLHTLPEVVSEEPSSEELFQSQSTEEICNEINDCFTFKSINNPGLYRAYHNKGKSQVAEYEDETYLQMVKQVQIPPVSRIVRSLEQSSMQLQYYGLDQRQIKPLSEVLTKNQTVQELNLKGNSLNEDNLFHLGQMLRKNNTLVKLNLQHCQINAEGAELLGNGLEVCERLRELDLSHNQFGDEGMELLGMKFGYNSSIKKLNLSHNGFTHKSGFFLAETMEENNTIEDLDLSWNQISEPEGLKKFLYAAAELNESLLKLNLSWNNLGGEKTAAILKNFISQHKSIKELNLSYNKLETESETTKLAKAINTAVSLKQLNLSYNGITADVGFAIISSINGNKAKMDKLIIENLWVNPEFHKLSKQLQMQCGLRVEVQGVYGGVDIKPPDMQSQLLQRARFLGYKPKKKKNKKDFGWFLLRLQNAGNLTPVSKAKFIKLIEEDKIKFDEGMVEEFAKRFKNANKKVDLNLMLERYLSLYPDTVLPKPKEKKKKKGKEKEEPELLKSEQVGDTEIRKGSKEVRISVADEKRSKKGTIEMENLQLETKLKTSLRSETSKKRVSFAEPNEMDNIVEDFIESEEAEKSKTQEEIKTQQKIQESEGTAENKTTELENKDKIESSDNIETRDKMLSQEENTKEHLNEKISKENLTEGGLDNGKHLDTNESEIATGDS